MSETMLLRLAEILQENELSGGAHDGETSDAMASARRLLQSMIEPTDDMVYAGAEIVPGADPAMHSEVAKDVWRAMVRAALVS